MMLECRRARSTAGFGSAWESRYVPGVQRVIMVATECHNRLLVADTPVLHVLAEI
jgi:hypothetical protein